MPLGIPIKSRLGTSRLTTQPKKVSTSLGHTAWAGKQAKVAWTNSGFAKFAFALVLGLAVHASAARVVALKRGGASVVFVKLRR